MELTSIGENIRRFRLAKKMRQEDLAERVGLSCNYIGMIERGEKVPSLDSFINLVNALGVSADMVLADVLENGYAVKTSMLTEKLEQLCAADRAQIYDVVDVMLRHSVPKNHKP